VCEVTLRKGKRPREQRSPRPCSVCRQGVPNAVGCSPSPRAGGKFSSLSLSCTTAGLSLRRSCVVRLLGLTHALPIKHVRCQTGPAGHGFPAMLLEMSTAQALPANPGKSSAVGWRLATLEICAISTKGSHFVTAKTTKRPISRPPLSRIGRGRLHNG
jgi:hypothetical protein